MVHAAGGRRGEKMGGEGSCSVNGDCIFAAHLFPFYPRVRRTIPRDATASSGTSNEQPLLTVGDSANAFGAGGMVRDSVERNLQRTTTLTVGERNLHNQKKCYFCTVKSNISHYEKLRSNIVRLRHIGRQRNP